MTAEPSDQGVYAQRMSGGGDRVYCSLCGGATSGDEPECPQCHASFGTPPPSPNDDAGSRFPRRRSTYIGLLQFALWVIALALVYVRWHVGSTLGGVVGSIVGPCLFVTIFTPIYAMWVYTAYRLPEPNLRGFAFDLLGFWTITACTLGLPVSAALIIFSTGMNWVSDVLSFAVFGMLLVMCVYHAQSWRRLFDGPISMQVLEQMEMKHPRPLLVVLLVQMFIVIILPFSFFWYARQQFPAPYSSIGYVGNMLWLFLISLEKFRNRMDQAIARPLGRLLRRPQDDH